MHSANFRNPEIDRKFRSGSGLNRFESASTANCWGPRKRPDCAHRTANHEMDRNFRQNLPKKSSIFGPKMTIFGPKSDPIHQRRQFGPPWGTPIRPIWGMGPLGTPPGPLRDPCRDPKILYCVVLARRMSVLTTKTSK